MKFSFKFKNRKFKIEVRECRSLFSQATGLMFRRKSPCLLFVFKKRGGAIHSFFCRPFIAIWFEDDELIDAKLIDELVFSVRPGKKFNKLLEVPVNDKNFEKLKKLVKRTG